MLIRSLKKRALHALFFTFLATSACSPQCNHWKLAVIKADCPSASYVKVYLPTCNTFDGLEAVLINCNNRILFYLYSFTLSFPSNECDRSQTDINLSIDKETFNFTAERLQGGQSLLLSNEAMLLIVSSLLERKNVEITVGRYQTTLTYENFDKNYEILTSNIL